MALDTSIPLQVAQPNILGAVQQGLAIRREREIQPVQQASALNKLEEEKLQLEQKERDDSFQRFMQTYQLPVNETGQINVGQAAEDMVKAGHGQMALQGIDKHLQANASMAKNRIELEAVVRNAAIQVAQAYRDQPKAAQDIVAESADAHFKKTYGISPNELLGKDWIRAAFKAPTTEVAAAGERRADITQLTTKEDLDPNSTKSKAFRQFYFDQSGQQLPASLSVGDASRNPAYQNIVESYLISQGQRTEAVGTIAATEERKTKLTGIKTGVEELKNKTWYKPAERIANIFKSITNDAERAKFQQLQSELSSVGITVDENTTLQGAVDALNRQLQEVGEKQVGAKAIATGKNIPQVAEKVTTGKTTPFVDAKGRVYNLTKEDQVKLKSAIDGGALKRGN